MALANHQHQRHRVVLVIRQGTRNLGALQQSTRKSRLIHHNKRPDRNERLRRLIPAIRSRGLKFIRQFRRPAEAALAYFLIVDCLCGGHQIVAVGGQ